MVMILLIKTKIITITKAIIKYNDDDVDGDNIFSVYSSETKGQQSIRYIQRNHRYMVMAMMMILMIQ